MPASAPAASDWLAPNPISAPGVDAKRGDIAVDRDGDILVVWERNDTLEAVFRPAGGTFGAPQPVASGGLPTAASVGFDHQGGVILVWGQGEGAIRRTFASYRPDGGTFGAGVPISAPGVFTDNPEVVVDRSGNALAVWQQNGLGVAYRPAGGSFGDPTALGPAGAGNNGLDVAFDDEGNAILVAARLDTVAGSTSYIEAAYRPAGGAFGAVTPVASAVDGAGSPAVAFDSEGNAIAVYLLWDTTVTDPQPNRYRVYTASRPAGGSFGSSQPVSTTNRAAWVPDVALYPDGTAIAVWMQGFQPQGAIRPPGGTFGAQQRLSPAVHDSLNGPGLSIDADGTAHIIWSGTDGTGYAARAVARPAGGSFSEMQTLSGTLVHSNDKVLVAADALGNAASLWRRSDGTNQLYEIAGYDSAPPELRELVIPSEGTAGTPLAFGVNPVDVWSSVTTLWDFGDGATADGAEVRHTYGSAGSFGARVTATDSLGNAASMTQTVAIAAASAPGGDGETPDGDAETPDGDGETPDGTSAVAALGRLQLSPRKFRAARRGPSARSTRRPGATVSFRLDRVAVVRFKVERALRGRRVGGRCVKQDRSNRDNRRCTRHNSLSGSFTRDGEAGRNRFRFMGRLRGRHLRPARYRLVAVPRSDGRRGEPKRKRFRIIR